MKKAWSIIVVLLIVVALVLFLKSNPSGTPATGVSSARVLSPGQPGNASVPANPAGTTAATSTPGAGTASLPKSPANLAANAGMVEPASATVPPDISPEIVVQNVRHAITQYGAMFGGNPVGTNPEITAALAGNNPKQINFIQPEAGMRISESGELVDAWGTPLFFHQLSGADTEVRSAGPDLKMWTPDDLVTR
jgi:hypothetical protein